MASEGENNLPYWLKRWNDGQIGWHETERNPMIEKHYEEFTGGKGGDKLFFPLCGKNIDMKWLADLGYTVVGVEGCDDPCREFFEENSVEYTKESQVKGFGGHLYKSKDEKIRIYCGNFFEFSSVVEQDFDAVWDRGAFVAISSEDRDNYAKLMSQKGLLGNQCRYFLESFEYDPSLYPGPPNYVSEPDIHRHFSGFDIEKRDSKDYSNDGPFGLAGVKAELRLHVLTPKC